MVPLCLCCGFALCAQLSFLAEHCVFEIRDGKKERTKSLCCYLASHSKPRANGNNQNVHGPTAWYVIKHVHLVFGTPWSSIPTPFAKSWKPRLREGNWTCSRLHVQPCGRGLYSRCERAGTPMPGLLRDKTQIEVSKHLSQGRSWNWFIFGCWYETQVINWWLYLWIIHHIGV